MSRKSTSPLDLIGDEYEVISFRLSWGAVSLLLFLLTLPTRYLLFLQPWRPRNLYLWQVLPPIVIGALSALGLAAGLIGLRFSASRGMSRMGVLLNAVVLVIILLFLAGMRMVLRPV